MVTSPHSTVQTLKELFQLSLGAVRFILCLLRSILQSTDALVYSLSIHGSRRGQQVKSEAADGLLVCTRFFVRYTTIEIVGGQPRCKQQRLLILFSGVGKVRLCLGMREGIFRCTLGPAHAVRRRGRGV